RTAGSKNFGEHMYCQSCGAEIQPGLNYCNRCGGVVNATLTTTGVQSATVDIKSPVRTIAATVCFTTLLGFIILFTAVDAMGARGFPAELLGLFGSAGLFLILVIDVLLLRLLSRLIHFQTANPNLVAAPKKRKAAREVPPAQTPAYIAAAATDPLPVSSVTDHTTRTFHPVYKEPRANS
ncbi:MAG TPA: hypothetical protein VJT82_07880, partial [Pyrinomonadaceae bacterium]|nr:hypothetical protein [Pyrinomonadaceae bacterium]